jgi:hypothetical protein
LLFYSIVIFEPSAAVVKFVLFCAHVIAIVE